MEGVIEEGGEYDSNFSSEEMGLDFGGPISHFSCKPRNMSDSVGLWNTISRPPPPQSRILKISADKYFKVCLTLNRRILDLIKVGVQVCMYPRL